MLRTFKKIRYYTIPRINSKIESLIALFFMYDKPFSILRALISKNVVSVKINIRKGIEITLPSKNAFIRLAKYLYRLKDANSLRINDYFIEVGKGDFHILIRMDKLTDEMSRLEVYSITLPKFLKVKVIDNKRLHIEYEDNTKWIIRKDVIHDWFLGPGLPLHERYEYHEWFSKLIKKIRTFIDVGAYIGGYAVRACRAGINVICFEPDPDNFSLLKTNIKLNKHKWCCATLHNMAAGSSKVKANLFAGRNPATMNLIGYGKQKYTVNVVPLDDVIDLWKAEKPILMKIDVEGYEDEVIMGAQNVLRYVKYLIIELNPHKEKQNVRILKSLGFKLLDRAPNSANVLFVR